MLNRFVYIVCLMVAVPCALLAKTGKSKETYAIVSHFERTYLAYSVNNIDTIKFNKAAVKADLKLKELPKPKRQPKPEKVDDAADAKKVKAKRERRPDGMDRPPEIPRRNDN